MDKDIKLIGGLSRKTKINIFIAVFLIFILISVLTSINQISIIIRNREKIVELEQRLEWERQQNIKLLAEEKTLYDNEAIELEARRQFNMTVGEETNYFVEIDNTGQKVVTEQDQDYSGKVYVEADLWENFRTFYNSEMRQVQ